MSFSDFREWVADNQPPSVVAMLESAHAQYTVATNTSTERVFGAANFVYRLCAWAADPNIECVLWVERAGSYGAPGLAIDIGAASVLHHDTGMHRTKERPDVGVLRARLLRRLRSKFELRCRTFVSGTDIQIYHKLGVYPGSPFVLPTRATFQLPKMDDVVHEHERVALRAVHANTPLPYMHVASTLMYATVSDGAHGRVRFERVATGLFVDIADSSDGVDAEPLYEPNTPIEFLVDVAPLNVEVMHL